MQVLINKTIVILTLLVFCFFSFVNPKKLKADTEKTLWQVQSIDTMKFSRDLARQKLNDKAFEEIIDIQINNITETGATHVAIGTPYDKEFIPFIKKWVSSARKNNLNVWFRGNFSGWEGWFGYSPISSDEHIEETRKFILENQELFEDGDIFTSCTECENGGPGDPRDTGDVMGFREFLIKEYQVTKETFSKIGKDVASNYFSMNGDVANLAMDKDTTKKLDGVVVIDHYVEDPEQLSKDIKAIIDKTGGKVILGEFGAPIPNIHGYMTENQQARWLDNAFFELSKVDGLVGINYWTSIGGSTQIWNSDGSKRRAVDIIKSYYSPRVVSGKVVSELSRPIRNAKITGEVKEVFSDENGNFSLVILPSTQEITIDIAGYNQKIIDVMSGNLDEVIVLTKTRENIFFKIQKAIYKYLKKLPFL